MQKNQKGFSVIEILIIVVVILLLVGVGSFVFSRNKKDSPAKTSTQSSTSSNETAQRPPQNLHEKQAADPNIKPSEAVKTDGWQTYKNTDAQLTFKYPKNWTVAPDDVQVIDGMVYAKGAVKSPGGESLKWTFNSDGGIGFSCEPDQNAVPFADGNECPTKQILSVESLPALKGTKNEQLHKLYLTKTKYRDSENSPILYQLCLESLPSQYSAPLKGTYMDSARQCDGWPSFYVTFDVKDLAAFDSDEAKTAEQIMRTFDSL